LNHNIGGKEKKIRLFEYAVSTLTHSLIRCLTRLAESLVYEDLIQ